MIGMLAARPNSGGADCDPSGPPHQEISMRRIKGKLCQNSKGRFTRCRKATKKRKVRSAAKKHCRFGRVKSGARKGLCRKVRRTARKSSARKHCRFGIVRRGPRKGRCLKARRAR